MKIQYFSFKHSIRQKQLLHLEELCITFLNN